MSETVEGVYLSRRNLLTLLSKLDRRAAGGATECTIIKRDDKNPKYAQTCPMIVVEAVEDDEYYGSRERGRVHPLDNPESQDANSTQRSE
jgi:hypothetical protein